jgi:hypothetical protein
VVVVVVVVRNKNIHNRRMSKARSKNTEEWSVEQVGEWLASVGFDEKHVALFVDAEINGEALFCLQTSDFTELVSILIIYCFHCPIFLCL